MKSASLLSILAIASVASATLVMDITTSTSISDDIKEGVTSNIVNNVFGPNGITDYQLNWVVDSA